MSLEDIKEEVEGRVQALMDTMFGVLGEYVEDLDRREQALSSREQELDEALVEVESLLEDLEATDPDSAYETVPTYESEGETYVLPSYLARRDQHILATLQRIASQDEKGQWVVSGVSNKDLAQVGSSKFDPLTPSSVSAALTRLSRQGLVDTQAMSGRGYPRRILLRARLEPTKEG